SAIVHLHTLISSTPLRARAAVCGDEELASLLGLQTSCQSSNGLLNQDRIDPDVRHCQHARNLGIPSDLTRNFSEVEHELLSSMAIASAQGGVAVK
ncbi:hypothetical protein, partial [Sinorhizobium meliloti]|uniref:hypothetical protein n=1 Tax=Rhizobium meliloti TaxID=382 RepID=UPI001AED2C54